MNPQQSHQQQQSTWAQAKQWIGKGWHRFCMVVNLPTVSALAGKIALLCCNVMCGVQTGSFSCVKLNILLVSWTLSCSGSLEYDLAEIRVIYFALAAFQTAAGESVLRCLGDLHACLQMLLSFEGVISESGFSMRRSRLELQRPLTARIASSFFLHPNLSQKKRKFSPT